jgi:hypothetical protein
MKVCKSREHIILFSNDLSLHLCFLWYSINKPDDNQIITEILLKVKLNTITLTLPPMYFPK